jgi:lipopolysaccharide/colanic/teichoic acid biosynthesis glycosyltransferase
MSIVGPRPQLVCDMVFMSEEVKKRHLVRSGLTGLAQVNGRNNLTWEEKFEYDLKYIQKISLFGDVKIIFQTVIKVLKKSDVSRDGMETDINYGDWLLNKGDITKEEYDEKQALAKQLLKG